MSANVYWGNEQDLLELGTRFEREACDESNGIMHRFCRAFGVPYSINHNYWRVRSDAAPQALTPPPPQEDKPRG